MTQSMAVSEMYRLKGAAAWSPLSDLNVRRKRNQHSSVYTFVDGSRLVVYLNGDAAYDDGYGLQRWPNWHRCREEGL